MSSIFDEIELAVDDDHDERAPLDEYTIHEIELDKKLKTISSFKETISKEPEFCGIFSLSSYNILRMFDDSSNVILKNRTLTPVQHCLIKTYYNKLNNGYVDDNYVHQVGFNIIDTIYV